MDGALTGSRQVQARLRRAPVFKAEKGFVRRELLNQGGRRSHPPEQLLQHVVVNQGQPDILVPPGLPGFGVNFAKQVQARALACNATRNAFSIRFADGLRTNCLGCLRRNRWHVLR